MPPSKESLQIAYFFLRVCMHFERGTSHKASYYRESTFPFQTDSTRICSAGAKFCGDANAIVSYTQVAIWSENRGKAVKSCNLPWLVIQWPRKSVEISTYLLLEPVRKWFFYRLKFVTNLFHQTFQSMVSDFHPQTENPDTSSFSVNLQHFHQKQILISPIST